MYPCEFSCCCLLVETNHQTWAFSVSNQEVRNNSNSSCYHVVHVINEAHVKDENSQKLIFWVACVPLTGSTPLLETIESTLSSVDCSSGQQRWRKLKHLILHERKLDQEEGKKFKLFWGHKNNSIRFLLLWQTILMLEGSVVGITRFTTDLFVRLSSLEEPFHENIWCWNWHVKLQCVEDQALLQVYSREGNRTSISTVY